MRCLKLVFLLTLQSMCLYPLYKQESLPDDFKMRLQHLPVDLKKDLLLRYFSDPYPKIDAIAHHVKEFEIFVTESIMLELFLSLRYKVHALDLAQRLPELKVLQDTKIKNWLDRQKKEVAQRQQLLAACKLGNEHIVAFYLADRAIDLNAQDIQTGFTPAMYAVQGGHDKIVMYLLAAGADFDKKAFDGTCARSFKW